MKNKNLLISLAIVLVVVGFIIWVVISSTLITPNDNGDNTNVSLPANINENKTRTEDTSAGSIHAGVSKSSISYADALLKYENARIQLNSDCQAIPNNMTFKNGTSIMIDNRASFAVAVRAGSVFSIKAYGFKILKLSSKTLPATWLVDCGASQNVATILIQK